MNNWEEFRKTGLLHFVNEFLHIFGWALVLTPRSNGGYTCVPERVAYTGFSEKSNEQAYGRVRKFMHSDEYIRNIAEK